MLTRLRVEGFKNLLDIDVQFGSFTCLAGPNGAGKSNIFDAIHFLHLLTQHPIMEAVRRLREVKGRSPEPSTLFTTFEDFRAPLMRFSAEMIVERDVRDEFGTAAEASISTLRYVVAFRLAQEGDSSRLELAEERLEPISLGDARRTLRAMSSKKFIDSTIKGRRTVPLISSSDSGEITVHQEGHGGRKLSAPKSSRTVLGGMATSDFPTILAVHLEMASWRTLMLEPSAMRAPSFYSDPAFIDNRGANLAAAIRRLEKLEDRPGRKRSQIASRLSDLIDDARELHVRDDPVTETLTVEVRGRDRTFFPARSLSDGTLRFLVLAALSVDPEVRGVICLEEPENGIHPARMSNMVDLLRDIAADSKGAVDEENPLRQIIVNTHSPTLFNNVSPDELIYIDTVQVNEGKGFRGSASVFLPKPSWRWKNRMSDRAWALAPGSIRSYVRNPVTGNQLWLPFAEQLGDGR